MTRQTFSMEASVALVRRAVRGLTPHPVAVLLAGSRRLGLATPASDFDIVLLYGELPKGAWREMVRFEEADLEFFAHDLETLLYFCERVERPSGEAALSSMIVEGFAVTSTSEELLESARRIAQSTLDSGPAPLDQPSIDSRRYAITDLAEGLRTQRSASQRLSIGVLLFELLTDFVLRAQGRWSAGGKALPEHLIAVDAGLERDVFVAFERLYSARDSEPVQQLVDAILAPYGGRLRSGFRQQAPADWRLRL